MQPPSLAACVHSRRRAPCRRCRDRRRRVGGARSHCRTLWLCSYNHFFCGAKPTHYLAFYCDVLPSRFRQDGLTEEELEEKRKQLQKQRDEARLAAERALKKQSREMKMSELESAVGACIWVFAWSVVPSE